MSNPSKKMSSPIDKFEASQKNLIDAVGIESAHLAWCLAMLWDEADVMAVHERTGTDGGGDKKVDFFDLDEDQGILSFGQGYFSKSPKQGAPANKASDLNTAAAWILDGDAMSKSISPKLVPKLLKARELLSKGAINTVAAYYIHNLPETKNVRDELTTCEKSLFGRLQSKGIAVVCKEIGLTEQHKMLSDRESYIAVKDDIPMPSPTAFTKEKGKDWEAQVFCVTGKWLRDLYQKYGSDLFAANYRGFLGTKGKSARINVTIAQTAEKTPSDFWAFNNGITILTSGIVNAKGNDGSTILNGASIINGAQTTGAISTLSDAKTLEDVKVLCKVVVCKDHDKAKLIVKYNNTQNVISSWDQYSNDSFQKTIETSFARLGHSYSIKRGFDAAESPLSIDLLAQPSLAFRGSFSDASRSKNSIFNSPELYRRAFEQRTPEQLLLYLAFSKCIDAVRLEIKAKQDKTGAEEKQLRLFDALSFKYFFLALLGGTLEAHIGRSVSLETIGFKSTVAEKSLDELVSLCMTATRMTLRLTENVLTMAGGFTADRDVAFLSTVSSSVSALLSAVYSSNEQSINQELSNALH